MLMVQTCRSQINKLQVIPGIELCYGEDLSGLKLGHVTLVDNKMINRVKSYIYLLSKLL